VLDLLLPQRCIACGCAGAQVCGPCTSGLLRIEPPLCGRCGAPTAWPVERCRECSGRRLSFLRARAAVAYDGPVPRIVSAWKERGLRRLADWAADCVTERLMRPEVDCIAFVPADRERRLRRGHHAAEALARAVGDTWDLPVVPLLARTRPARSQRGLSEAERRRNVAGAFRAVPAPARVLLVDDVYTTGASVNAAACALRKAGCRRVEVMTFARAIRVR
jgi:predicted amidophosphoribosyltransferase